MEREKKVGEGRKKLEREEKGGWGKKKVREGGGEVN